MNPRVTGAFVIGIALVLGAFTLSRFGVSKTTDPIATTGPVVAVAQEPLRQYIPTEDSNNDGVPDWQEMLNDTPPLTLTEATEYTPPETLTDQFALEFFEGYMRNERYGDFGQSPETLINDASVRLAGEVQDTLYTETSITMIPSSPAGIRVHANAVAQAIANTALPAGTPNELDVMEEVIATGNNDRLAALDPIITNYDQLIKAMLAIPVPTEMVKEHLDLVNAFQAVHNDILGMQTLSADPLYTLLRLQRYQDDVRGMAVGIENLFTKARNLGDPLLPTDPVFTVFSFE